MANTYKNIVITPNKGSSTGDPTIVFSGANTTVNTDITLRAYPTSNGTLSFEGSAGQLFSITNDLTGTLFSVNDISGMPSIEVDSNGKITLAQYSGNVGIGTGSPAYKLDVAGDMRVTGNVIMGDASTDTITLNGSVISLGNNQSIDAGTLFIDATNNEVGIGTTNPTSNLHVIGTANITSSVVIGTTNVVPTIQAAFLAANAAFANANTTHTLTIAAFAAANASFANGNTNFTTFQVASNVANNGWLQANTARIHANAAFLAANTLTKLAGRDLRTIYPANTTNGYVEVGFTSWTNNATSPYADFIHLRSYTDASGGNDNLLMLRKDAIGMRLWQHSYFATTPYSTFKDVAFTTDLATGNAAFLAANAAFANANTTHTLTIAAFSAANASFANGNTNFTTIQTVFGVANASFANGNTNFTVLQTVFGAANAAFANANSTHTLTIAAFAAANASFANANTTHTLTIASFNAANAAFSNANSTHTLTIASFAAANASYANANTTHTLTIAAFDAANASFANGNTNFTTLQTVFGAANSAFANANSTHTLAIAAFTQANTANNLTVANTGTVVGSRNVLNFIPGGNVTISFADDAAGNRLNVTIAATGSSSGGGLSYTSNVGDAVANTFNITHALNSTTIVPAVRERSTGYYVYPDMKVTSPNNIVIEFVSVPTANQYFLIVLGV